MNTGTDDSTDPTKSEGTLDDVHTVHTDVVQNQAGQEQPGAPVRRRMGLKLLTVALVVVVVAGGSFLIFDRQASADAAVADAVNSALASRSADVVISGSAQAAGTNITMAGTGSIDFQQNAMQMAINVTGGPQKITEQAVYLNKVIYLNFGNDVGKILPGKSWLSLDLSQLSGGGAASSLGSGSPLSSDPAAVLQALRQEGNTATDLGQSTINGMSVEGYSVRLNPAAIKKDIDQANLPAWMKQAAESVSNENVDYKVYVDSSGDLARLTTDLSLTASGTSIIEGMNMDFVHYGATVNVTAPPAGAVASFQSFLQAAESQPSSAGSTN
jgi:hypothetical protein